MGFEKNITLVLFGILVLIISPAYAEVTSFQLDETFYIKGDQISYSGTVDTDSSGLVSIIFRDGNDGFVLLTQAYIQPDSTFQKSISTDSKFNYHGIHNATAFIQSMIGGNTVQFDFSLDGLLPNPSVTQDLPVTPADTDDSVTDETNLEPKIINQVTPEPEVIDEVTPEPEPILENQKSDLAGFVDPEKDPQYYLNRYYNESGYRDWFDTNYPEITIEEAVGAKYQPSLSITETIEEKMDDVIPNEIIPDAQAASAIIEPLSSNNSESREFALFGLALGGLAVLFGAVYGIKRRVDTNSENISHNRESIRKKMFSTILGNKPMNLIQNRLANGEITIREYNKLKKTLN